MKIKKTEDLRQGTRGKVQEYKNSWLSPHRRCAEDIFVSNNNFTPSGLA